MSIVNKVKTAVGIVNVQIEGFFTERFINLCKINNIKIWDIRNVVKGVIRFNISISDFEKLRKVARKTKCKIVIKNKKGIYFTLFKYRKRKIFFVIAISILILSILLSTFVWKIDIQGNEKLSETQIISALKESGLYVGKNKTFLDKKEVTNLLRLNITDISWAGIELNGTKAIVKIVEKTRLDEKNVQDSGIGNIVAQKSGIITKIVPENGTAKFKEGSYICKGDIAIEGMIYSKYMEPAEVTAKGILQINTEYTFEKTYNYNQVLKENTNKKLYTIGISINSNENMLNYLNKKKKYDITRSSKGFNLFGNQISFDIYTCTEYIENEIEYTKEQLIEFANKDIEEYLNNEILPSCISGSLIDKNVNIEDIEDGIKVNVVYQINEEVDKFVKTKGE